MSDNAKSDARTDVVLVGAGIMSATLGALLRLVEPDWSITLVERLDAAAAESSDPWNNAGTGHSALCELNYTPQKPDGTIDIAKAIAINEQFQVTRQFWAYAHENGILTDVRSFLNPVPHVSFVQGAEHVDYLRRRQETLIRNPLFASMEFIDGADEFARRLPLMAEGRDFSEPVALNWTEGGTDVDFGALSRQLLAHGTAHGMDTLFGHEVRDLDQESDGSWTVKILNRRTGEKRRIRSRFVFIGAGGGALPVSGMWLRTNKPELTGRHHAKVYGLPPLGAPPMSVPHLDTRVITGKDWLLFGPFAGWSPKFLKTGKVTDLPLSVKPDNLLSMVGVGLTELSLLKYLIGELLQSFNGRVDTLRQFAPTAQGNDWEIDIAGQRVQVIRRDPKKLGVLEFGTTVLAAADGSIAGLLGASPGASTAVPAMMEVMQRCFPGDYPGWEPKLREMVPSLGTKLSEEPGLFAEVWDHGTRVLGLHSRSGVV
jgi:malate dehydrogenase (quinone)